MFTLGFLQFCSAHPREGCMAVLRKWFTAELTWREVIAPKHRLVRVCLYVFLNSLLKSHEVCLMAPCKNSILSVDVVVCGL